MGSFKAMGARPVSSPSTATVGGEIAHVKEYQTDIVHTAVVNRGVDVNSILLPENRHTTTTVPEVLNSGPQQYDLKLQDSTCNTGTIKFTFQGSTTKSDYTTVSKRSFRESYFEGSAEDSEYDSTSDCSSDYSESDISLSDDADYRGHRITSDINKWQVKYDANEMFVSPVTTGNELHQRNVSVYDQRPIKNPYNTQKLMTMRSSQRTEDIRINENGSLVANDTKPSVVFNLKDIRGAINDTEQLHQGLEKTNKVSEEYGSGTDRIKLQQSNISHCKKTPLSSSRQGHLENIMPMNRGTKLMDKGGSGTISAAKDQHGGGRSLLSKLLEGQGESHEPSTRITDLVLKPTERSNLSKADDERIEEAQQSVDPSSPGWGWFVPASLTATSLINSFKASWYGSVANTAPRPQLKEDDNTLNSEHESLNDSAMIHVPQEDLEGNELIFDFDEEENVEDEDNIENNEERI